MTLDCTHIIAPRSYIQRQKVHDTPFLSLRTHPRYPPLVFSSCSASAFLVGRNTLLFSDFLFFARFCPPPAPIIHHAKVACRDWQKNRHVFSKIFQDFLPLLFPKILCGPTDENSSENPCAGKSLDARTCSHVNLIA